MKKIGLLVIVVGIAMAVFTGFDYFTREKVIDVGSVEVTADKRHTVDWPPILGIVIAVVGAGLYFSGPSRISR